MSLFIPERLERSAFPRPSVEESSAKHPERLRVQEHLTFTEASDLLDSLEAHGIESMDVQIEENGEVTVRWVC